MKLQLTRRSMLATATAFAAVRPAFADGHGTEEAAAEAATGPVTHEVQMLTKHPENKKLRNVFTPRVLAVEVGDTVTWLPTEKGHNSAAIKGMVPEGVELWKGAINKEISITFDKPGIYGYACTPHLALGMVGLVVVKGEGMMDNLEAAKGVKQRGKAAKIFDEIWAEMEAMELS